MGRLRRWTMCFAVAALVTAGSALAQTPTANTDELTLVLNIPAFRLDLFRGETRVTSYVVAVGLPRYRTPVGDFVLTDITWNPWWYPPDSEWARHEKITPPGSSNPMGKVKLHLGGRVYLHASPFSASIGRAASHGCARMLPADAIALARMIQQRNGSAIAEAAVDSLIASWDRTRVVSVPGGVRTRIEYRLIEVRQDSLLLHPDIYRLGKANREIEALRALAQTGYDTTEVDRNALRFAVRQSRSKGVSLPIIAILGKRGAEVFDDRMYLDVGTLLMKIRGRPDIIDSERRLHPFYGLHIIRAR